MRENQVGDDPEGKPSQWIGQANGETWSCLADQEGQSCKQEKNNTLMIQTTNQDVGQASSRHDSPQEHK
jgi:hypothetical protein